MNQKTKIKQKLRTTEVVDLRCLVRFLRFLGFWCPDYYVWKKPPFTWRFAISNRRNIEQAKKMGAKVIWSNLILIPHHYYQEALYVSPKSDLLHLPSYSSEEFHQLGADKCNWSALGRCFHLASKRHPDLVLLKLTFWSRLAIGFACDYVTRPLSYLVDLFFQPNVKDESSPEK